MSGPSTPYRSNPRSSNFSTPGNSSINTLPNTTLPAPFSTTSLPRLQALYSDFSRQKSSNPTSYNANVDWWKRALESLVGASDDDDDNDNDRLVLHANRDLMERVKIPKVGKPLALGSVLSEQLQTTQPQHRFALPLALFLSSKTPLVDPPTGAFTLPLRIASFVIGKPLWWALEQVGLVSDDGGSRHDSHKDTSWYGDYVLLSLVQNAAEHVLERQEETLMGNKGDALYTFDEFRKVFGVCVSSSGGTLDSDGSSSYMMRDTDAKVLVKYLEREIGIVVVDKDVIKFIDASSSPDEHTITAVDRGILELKTAIRNLQSQIDGLHKKIDECTKKASTALQQNRKPAALTYLRSRKQLEDLLQKRLGSLTTLEATFISVEAAAGDVDILKSYELSTTTLRSILAHPSLERSAIDKTMEALAEANADAREMDDAVRFGGNVAVGVDDALVDEDELEEELKALVKEAEKEQGEEVERKLSKAGRVPSGEKGKTREAIAIS